MSVSQLATCVSCHAWNRDKTRVAFCPNNNEVHIYRKEGSGFAPEFVLKEHDQLVTGIDWGQATNRIVTCSQDRNAYVWTFQQNQWKPTLVILRINRAATCVKWSPNETKFAVASGAKCVSVCYFEEDNDWWVSKHIKKHKSTVTSIAWHPNSVLLATASSDFKARVFSAFIKGVDQRPTDTPWGNQLPFGQPLVEYNAAGWVHDVAWSPSGSQLAFVAHDSSIHFVDVTSGAIDKISLSGLPFRCVEFFSENTVVAAGHDCNPAVFTAGGGGWQFAKYVDEARAAAGPQSSGTRAAMNMWQKKVDLGTESVETTLNTKHQNAISCLCVMGRSGPKVSNFSTTGVDGKIIVWDANSIPQ